MARVNLTLTATPRPAFDALLDCAHEIAETHGEDAAVAWAQAVLSRDFDLFVKLSAGRAKPRLRVIQGGR